MMVIAGVFGFVVVNIIALFISAICQLLIGFPAYGNGDRFSASKAVTVFYPFAQVNLDALFFFWFPRKKKMTT